MKRIAKGSLCLLLVMIFLSSTIEVFADSTIQLMVVNVSGARLRSGPGSSPVITTLAKGTRVYYLNKRVGSAMRVCTSDGKIGYIYHGFLDQFGACKASACYYVNVNSLTLRSKPSTKASAIKTLYKHYIVIVYKTSDNWAYVKTIEGKKGYVQLSGLKQTRL